MKKILSLILMFILLMQTVIFASEPVSEETEKILLSIKERIGNTEMFDGFDSSVYENKGKKVYSFNWYTKESEVYKSVNVECTDSGIITHYSSYEDASTPDSGKPSLKKISNEDALNKAKELVKKLNPAIAEKLIFISNDLNKNLFSNNFRFDIIRYENGYPVTNDTGNITLNPEADKITSFYINYSENITFKTPEKIIIKEEAQKAYIEKLGLELQYLSRYDNNTIKVLPCYLEKNSNSGKYINAENGELTEISFNNFRFYEEATADMAMATGANQSAKFALSEAENKEIENLEGLLSKEEIIRILKNNKYITYPNGYKLSRYNITKDNYTDNYYSRFYYEKTTGNKRISDLSFTVDAKNGRLKNYNYYDSENNSGRTTLSKDKSYTYLTEAIKNLADDIFSEYEETNFYYPQKTEKNNHFASLEYTRKINGIPYKNDSIIAELNLWTGKITSYNANYTDIEFPSADNLISIEEAHKVLFDKVIYDVNYKISDNNAVLVYMLNSNENIVINAENGSMLDYSLNEKNDAKISYTDIEKHYARDMINTLKDYGIGFSDDKFMPDTAIVQKDYIAMLVSAFYRGYIAVPLSESSDDAYRKAKQNGIIKEDEQNPEAKVTRSEAAKYFVRALGYDEIASIDGIYKTTFSDVTENIGYISILNGLGLINGDENGLFNPEKHITRAETAVIIYNYLVK